MWAATVRHHHGRDPIRCRRVRQRGLLGDTVSDTNCVLALECCSVRFDRVFRIAKA